MSAFRTAFKFFKTWFLPQQYDDDEIMDQQANHDAPGDPDALSAPASAPAPTPFEEPDTESPSQPEVANDPSSSEKPAVAHDLKESTSQASYAIPPVPAAMQPKDDDQPSPADEDDSTVNPADDPASFSHLVKPPNAADQRYSRRRMEGADPSAFE